MGCTVFSDSIKINLKQKSDISTYFETSNSATSYSTALQNPDMNRLYLAAILRSKDSMSRKKAKKSFWSTFQDNQITGQAND